VSAPAEREPPHAAIWPRRLPRQLAVPESTLWFNLEVSARRYPDKSAYVFFGRSLSFRELHAQALALAGWLQAHGVRRGDRVLLFMQNSPQYVIAFYAVQRADAVVVPVNPMNRADEFGHYITDPRARLAITSADLAAVVAERERADSPRWVWASTAGLYPRLLRHGVRVARCHDLELTEALLLGYDGRWGEPRSLAAVWARLHRLPVPADPAAVDAAPPGFGQEALFEDLPPAASGVDVLEATGQAYADQLARIAAVEQPGRFRLLVAAESAGALIGAEMGQEGLPWRADAHDEVLLELLGDQPAMGGLPRRLGELKEQIAQAFGGSRFNPESPAEVLRAFSREGIVLPSTRAWVLRSVDHPGVAPLLEFKELYRVWTAHAWSWRAQWVRDGRFRPEYVPGGVVSGRWASRGGGALQIPKVIRRAVVADDGWTFVVADAGQLEPRVLAAVAGDGRLAAAGGTGDLYAALAADAFAGDRAKAKVAMLGAMYGQTGGAAVPALAALQARFPTAWEYVERAARTGEGGGLVRSWLGRTCPPAGEARMTPEQARARGRFTRNFVIQATAAEWALTLLAALRGRLNGLRGRLVFFVHDEVVVHAPDDEVEQITEAVLAASEQASRLLFGDTPVRFPLDVSAVRCYADAA
jgi:DNA polymerase-1